jgi:hypothetical protein
MGSKGFCFCTILVSIPTNMAAAIKVLPLSSLPFIGMIV